jgi:hypothetical protein
MRKVANDPIFIYLGARLRGPDAPPVGSIKRVNGAALFDLRSVTDFAVRDTRRVKDQHIPAAGQRKRI